MDDRTLRVLVIVIGHVIFLSAGALRLIRGHRDHWLRSDAPWWIAYYPPLVWIPLLVATLVWKTELEIDDTLQAAGVPIALIGAVFAAWGMWSLGRGYGIRPDLFAEHRLKTDGAFAIVRHPMYLGILVYHVGASLALESPLLAVATIVFVLPYTLARIAAEERTLRQGFGERYDAYARAVPPLLPFPR